MGHAAMLGWDGIGYKITVIAGVAASLDTHAMPYMGEQQTRLASGPRTLLQLRTLVPPHYLLIHAGLGPSRPLHLGPAPPCMRLLQFAGEKSLHLNASMRTRMGRCGQGRPHDRSDSHTTPPQCHQLLQGVTF